MERREALEIPAQTSLEKKLLVTAEKPSKKPVIRPIDPNASSLVNRLRDFLPQIEHANKSLDTVEQIDVSQKEVEGCLPQVDVAKILNSNLVGDEDENQDPYIELDLACGVFDLKDDDAIAAAERSLIINPAFLLKSHRSDISSSSSSSSSESESEGDEENVSTSDEDAMKMKKHPGIEELT